MGSDAVLIENIDKYLLSALHWTFRIRCSVVQLPQNLQLFAGLKPSSSLAFEFE